MKSGELQNEHNANCTGVSIHSDKLQVLGYCSDGMHTITDHRESRSQMNRTNYEKVNLTAYFIINVSNVIEK